MAHSKYTLESLGFDGYKRALLADRMAWLIDSSGGQDACWPWTGSRNRSGYGTIGVGKRPGIKLLAHRVAYELASGPLKANACHSCDNPPCCNPRHLFDGTHRDNMDDAVRKGRMASGDRHGLRKHPGRQERGESHHNARLNERQVIEIRLAAATGERHETIGERFGVGHTTVSKIAQGRSWTHVGGPRTFRDLRGVIIQEVSP